MWFVFWLWLMVHLKTKRGGGKQEGWGRRECGWLGCVKVWGNLGLEGWLRNFWVVVVRKISSTMSLQLFGRSCGDLGVWWRKRGWKGIWRKRVERYMEKKGYNLLFIFRQSSLNNKQHAALIHFSFLSPSFILIEAPKIALVLLAPRVVQEKTGHS